jgi:hypothetical protein
VKRDKEKKHRKEKLTGAKGGRVQGATGGSGRSWGSKKRGFPRRVGPPQDFSGVGTDLSWCPGCAWLAASGTAVGGWKESLESGRGRWGLAEGTREERDEQGGRQHAKGPSHSPRWLQPSAPRSPWPSC